MAMTFHPELSLLQPVDPTQHSDDWPIFTLSGAEVFPLSSHSRTQSDYVSLLTADKDNPLLVRGKLSSLPRDLKHLRVRPSIGTENVVIEEVKQFAYGQYDDGRVELWAAGKSGWWALKPSKGYKRIFAGIIEAIEVWYCCVDAYSTSGKKSRKQKGGSRKAVQAQDVILRFAENNHLTVWQAEDVFTRHAEFLIGGMAAGKEGVDWDKTNLWEWMTETFPHIVQHLKIAQRATSKAGTKRKRSSIHEAGRLARSAGPSHPETPHRETSQDNSDVDSVASSKRPRRGKGKSILRPTTTSKYVWHSQAEPEHGDDSPLAGSNTPPILKVQQRPPMLKSTGSRHSQRLNMTETHSVGLGAEVTDEGIDMSLDHADEDDDQDDVQSEIALAFEDSLGNSIPMRLKEEHLAATEDGDVWSCPLDGCMQKIFAASQPSSQRLIKEHYRLHVHNDDADMRLELVRRMQAPGLPVDRLLGRIQALAGRKDLPTPILRRY